MDRRSHVTITDVVFDGGFAFANHKGNKQFLKVVGKRAYQLLEEPDAATMMRGTCQLIANEITVEQKGLFFKFFQGRLVLMSMYEIVERIGDLLRGAIDTARRFGAGLSPPQQALQAAVQQTSVTSSTAQAEGAISSCKNKGELESMYQSRAQLDCDVSQLKQLIEKAETSEDVLVLELAVKAESRLPALIELQQSMEKFRSLEDLEAEVSSLRVQLKTVSNLKERLTLATQIRHLTARCDLEREAAARYSESSHAPQDETNNGIPNALSATETAVSVTSNEYRSQPQLQEGESKSLFSTQQEVERIFSSSSGLCAKSEEQKVHLGVKRCKHGKKVEVITIDDSEDEEEKQPKRCKLEEKVEAIAKDDKKGEEEKKPTEASFVASFGGDEKASEGQFKEAPTLHCGAEETKYVKEQALASWSWSPSQPKKREVVSQQEPKLWQKRPILL